MRVKGCNKCSIYPARSSPPRFDRIVAKAGVSYERLPHEEGLPTLVTHQWRSIVLLPTVVLIQHRRLEVHVTQLAVQLHILPKKQMKYISVCFCINLM